MKRKFKLFATLASLCLSVALMAFGVYAATQSTFKVSSSVSFEAQVACTWDGKVYGGSESTAKDNSTNYGSLVSQFHHEATGTQGEQGYVPAETGVVNPTDATAAKVWDIDEVAFGMDADKAQNVIVYELSCTNNSYGKIKVSVTAVDAMFADRTKNDGSILSYTVTKKVGTGDASDVKSSVVTTMSDPVVLVDALAKDATVYLTITVTLHNYTVNVLAENNAFDLTLKAEPAESV